MSESKSCPECGAPWSAVSDVTERLSAWGYLHVDTTHECTECHASWMHGHPQGDGPAVDYTCPVCGVEDLRPHKIDCRAEPIHADMKCPACHYWTADVELIPLDNGEYTFAYPGLVGETSD